MKIKHFKVKYTYIIVHLYFCHTALDRQKRRETTC